MQKKRLPLRIALEILAVMLMGTGTSLLVKSNTGTSPLTSVALILNMVFPRISMGNYVFALNLLFFVTQFIVEPKGFTPAKLLQLAPTYLLGLAIDLNNFLLAGFVPANYAVRMGILLLGCLLYGLSIAMMVSSDLLLMPMDTLISLLALKLRTRWSNVKVSMDVILVAGAVAVGLICLGRIEGVREGTVIAAVIVGPFTRMCRPLTDWITGFDQSKQPA